MSHLVAYRRTLSGSTASLSMYPAIIRLAKQPELSLSHDFFYTIAKYFIVYISEVTANIGAYLFFALNIKLSEVIFL